MNDELNLTTHKNDVDSDELEDITDELYDDLSREEIEEVMKQHDILLTQEEVKEGIEKDYEYEDVIDYFNKKYKKQLEQLDSLHILLDKKCIYHYVLKIFKEDYLFNNIPRPDYLGEAFDEFEEIDDDEQPEYLLKILRSMNKLQDYYVINDLDEIFTGCTYVPVGEFLYQAFDEDMDRCQPHKDMSKKLSDEIFQLLEIYTFEDSSKVYQAALAFFEKYGVSN